ncbi:MAG: ankyrin repeat domain-containing protein [Methanoregula sp.]|jgi:hypothetical protein
MRFFSRLFKPIPFFDALRAGRVKDVRKYLESGIDPNEKVDGEYPIFFAVHTGTKIVELLIQYGARVNVTGRSGDTPLHLAAQSGYVDVVTLLISAGAHLNTQDNFGHTPLFNAAAAISPYDMIYVTSRLAPSEEYLQERSVREATVKLLVSQGATLSQDDIVTKDAMGSLPEADRQTRHETLAYKYGELYYHRAISEISMEYPFLHDAYRQLCNKTNLTPSEKIFIEKFEEYEKMVQ